MARYPLEAARTVRATVRERAERVVAEATRAQASATAAAVAAAEALRQFRSEQGGRTTGAPTTTTGAALHRERAFRDRIDQEEQTLVQALKTAASEERRRALNTREAKRALIEANVQEKVVDRHHERWSENEKRVAERAEEREFE